MIEIQKDSYNKKRGEIMERLTSKQILLVIIFIVIMIASFIYSPWENDSAIVISSMLDNGDEINNITKNFFVKCLGYGKFDWIEMIAYGIYEIVTMSKIYEGEWGLLGFFAVDVCLAAFLVFKVLVNYLEEEFFDTDEGWKLCIKRYMFESIITYVFCLSLHFVINYGIMTAIYWLYENCQLVAAILCYILPLIGFWMMLAIGILMMSYAVVIIIPALLLVLLIMIPGIGILFNSILGVIIFAILEIFMIFYVWNKWFADKAISISIRIALFPARFIYERFG